MDIPQGKGAFIWKIWMQEGSTIDNVNYDAIVQAILTAKLTHVYIKIADGEFPYNVRWENYPNWSGAILDDFAAELTRRLHEVGILVFGWQYVRGARPLDEAKIAIEQVKTLELDGFSIDAEAEYKLAGKAQAATTYADTLRAGIPTVPIALASYRYPDSHTQLPWLPFLARVNYVSQQLYWQGAHNPVFQLEKSLSQYAKLFNRLGITPLPQCPIGSGYGVGTWKATAQDITNFLKGCRDGGLKSASIWSYDWMRNPANNAMSLWQVLAVFDWPIEAPTPPPPPDRVTIEEWANTLDSDYRKRFPGYTGPLPPLS